jgi:cell division protein DivIC
MNANRLSKKTKRRIFIVSIITVGIMIAITYNVFLVWDKIIDLKSEKSLLTQNLSKMEEKENYLKEEVQKLKDPDYIARYAREKYLFSKDGEFTIKMPE